MRFVFYMFGWLACVSVGWLATPAFAQSESVAFSATLVLTVLDRSNKAVVDVELSLEPDDFWGERVPREPVEDEKPRPDCKLAVQGSATTLQDGKATMHVKMTITGKKIPRSSDRAWCSVWIKAVKKNFTTRWERLQIYDGDNTQVTIMQFGAGGTLSGRCIDKATGKPLGGIMVGFGERSWLRTSNMASRLATTVTAEDGRFTLRQVPPWGETGEFFFYSEQWTNESSVLNVSEDDLRQGKDVNAGDVNCVQSGRATFKAVSVDGKDIIPIVCCSSKTTPTNGSRPNERSRIYPPQPLIKYDKNTTTFSVYGLVPGSWSLRLLRESGEETIRSFAVKPGEVVDFGQMVLVKPYFVSVTVVDKSGNSSKGCRVAMHVPGPITYDPETGEDRDTNGDEVRWEWFNGNAVSFGIVMVGKMQITARYDDICPTTKTVDLKGEPLKYTLVLDDGATLAVNLIGRSGNPAKGIIVLVAKSSAAYATYLQTGSIKHVISPESKGGAIRKPEGTYRSQGSSSSVKFEHVVPDTYLVACDVDGEATTLTSEAALEEGKHCEVTLKVTVGSLKATVTLSGKPYSDKPVILVYLATLGLYQDRSGWTIVGGEEFRNRDRGISVLRTDKKGQFSANSLAPGNWCVITEKEYGYVAGQNMGVADEYLSEQLEKRSFTIKGGENTANVDILQYRGTWLSIASTADGKPIDPPESMALHAIGSREGPRMWTRGENALVKATVVEFGPVAPGAYELVFRTREGYSYKRFVVKKNAEQLEPLERIGHSVSVKVKNADAFIRADGTVGVQVFVRPQIDLFEMSGQPVLTEYHRAGMEWSCWTSFLPGKYLAVAIGWGKEAPIVATQQFEVKDKGLELTLTLNTNSTKGAIALNATLKGERIHDNSPGRWRMQLFDKTGKEIILEDPHSAVSSISQQLSLMSVPAGKYSALISGNCVVSQRIEEVNVESGKTTNLNVVLEVNSILNVRFAQKTLRRSTLEAAVITCFDVKNNEVTLNKSPWNSGYFSIYSTHDIGFQWNMSLYNVSSNVSHIKVKIPGYKELTLHASSGTSSQPIQPKLERE